MAGKPGKPGMAFALLAMLGLLLLIPVHHHHALHQALGSVTADAAHGHHAGHEHSDDPSPAFRCPVCTLGKLAVLVPPPDTSVRLALHCISAERIVLTAPVAATRYERYAQLRAPPVSTA